MSDIEKGKQDDTQRASEGQAEGNQRATNKNVKNVKKKKTPPKMKFSEKHLQLAYYFFDRILENQPERRPPNFEKWANTIRLMIEVDKRNVEQIQWLMTWVQQHNFWMTNVLSPEKLRDKFDDLAIKAKKEREQKRNANNSKQEATRRLLLEEGEDI
ncbi:Replication protein O [Listeria cornellensis FSL F6-0969]|uniref:Replication protein O n=1 Tax=Listeria cornellensis FSL F6-0969 TaxID=1265820 RepID=W7CA95_9LIST|nr:Replication protein O [Listeria cornellensis FSL F6-0969]